MIVENSFRCFIFLYNRKVNTFTETLSLGTVVLGLGVFEVSHIKFWSWTPICIVQCRASPRVPEPTARVLGEMRL